MRLVMPPMMIVIVVVMPVSARRRRSGAESRRRAAFPVRAERGRFAFEMQDDYFGEHGALSAVPLQCELNVGSGCIPVAVSVRLLMISASHGIAAVEKLEEPDRNVPVELTDPARAHLQFRVKPVPAFMGMIVPGAGVLLESLPLVPSDDVTAIRSIDFSLIEVRPVDELAEFSRQYDVGVEMQNPVLSPDLVEGSIDHAALIERSAALVFVGKDMMN